MKTLITFVEIVQSNVISVKKTKPKVISQYVPYVEEDLLKPMIKLVLFKAVLNVLNVQSKTVKYVILWIYKNVVNVLIIMLYSKINV